MKGRIRNEVEGEEEAGEKASKMEKASMRRGDQPTSRQAGLDKGEL